MVLHGQVSQPAAFGTPTWPQWRGPAGQGTSAEAGLPSDWAPDRNVLWKTPVPGRGYSSPIVWNSHLFLTTSFEGSSVPGAAPVSHTLGGEPLYTRTAKRAIGAAQSSVIALDAGTGKVLWQRTAYEGTVYDAAPPRKGSYANTTPATDGKTWSMCGSVPEEMHVYDFQRRARLEEESSRRYRGILGMGTGSSPVLYDNLVILQCDDEQRRAFVHGRARSSTGKEVWRTRRAQSRRAGRRR